MHIIILGNCAPGSYDDDTDCSLCAYGYYQDKWTQKNCTWCGNNLNTSRQGANSSEECQGKIYHWYGNHGNHCGEHYFRCVINLNTSRLGEECQGKINFIIGMITMATIMVNTILGVGSI